MDNTTPQVLQLDISGIPQAWISYEKAAYYYARNLIAWEPQQSQGIILRGGVSKKTGQQSLLILNSIIALGGNLTHKRAYLANYVPLTNKTLFRRDCNMCAYCGKLFSFDNLTRDHVLPRSKGGLDNWSNMVTSCGKCNRYKADRTPEEANMELLYIPYIPVRSEYLILSNRYILQDQMEYLLNRIPEFSRIKQKFLNCGEK